MRRPRPTCRGYTFPLVIATAARCCDCPNSPFSRYNARTSPPRQTSNMSTAGTSTTSQITVYVKIVDGDYDAPTGKRIASIEHNWSEDFLSGSQVARSWVSTVEAINESFQKSIKSVHSKSPASHYRALFTSRFLNFELSSTGKRYKIASVLALARQVVDNYTERCPFLAGVTVKLSDTVVDFTTPSTTESIGSRKRKHCLEDEVQ